MVEIVEKLERELGAASALLTSPRQGECLLCYAYRMTTSFGCDNTLRWAKLWRDLRAPRATAMERQLGSRGGYCDCEIFMNGWTAASTLTRTDPESEDEDEEDDEEEIWPDPMPSCNGIPPKSTQPCSLWSQRQRGPW